MKIYSRYIARKLLSSFLYCICSILAVVWLTRSNDLLQIIINNGIGLSSFFTFSLLAFPEILYNAIPIGAFIATISVFMRLRQTSEIFALQNAGLANSDLAKPVLTMVTLLVIAHLFIACSLSPMAKRTMARKINKFNEKVSGFMIEDRVFVHPTENLTIFTEKQSKLRVLSNVFVNDKRTANKDSVIFAKRGDFVTIDNQTFLHLFDGTRQTLSSDGFVSMDFSFLAINIDLQKKGKKSYEILPSEMGMWDLLTNRGNISASFVEIYNRISLPLVNYIVSLISLIMVMSYYKTSKSAFYTIINYVINFAIVICFIILNRLSTANYYYCFFSMFLLAALSIKIKRIFALKY